MECIFCQREESTDIPMSEEHVFPDAIGGSFVIRNVCRECNSRLGERVDARLTDHCLIKLKRLALGVAPTGGAVPNPFREGTNPDNSLQQIRYVTDNLGRNTHVFVVPNVTREQREDGEHVSISMDASELDKLPEIVNKILTRAGQPPMTDDQVRDRVQFCSDEEPEIQYQLEIDIHHYRRAILKIAYEMGCAWLGKDYVNDPTAEVIRNAIWDESDADEHARRYPIHGKIDFCSSIPNRFVTIQGSHQHLGSMVRLQDSIVLTVRIFDVIEGTVVLTHDAAAYSFPQNQTIVLDAVARTHRIDLLENLMVASLGNAS